MTDYTPDAPLQLADVQARDAEAIGDLRGPAASLAPVGGGVGDDDVARRGSAPRRADDGGRRVHSPFT